ncbi:hypothetical protein F4677DRAFT_413352 [Hypoxylon crocopeplum]|nr:hypothetical protein F4677DRAFT_413352 [Hypoxylon crocopeplum]
MAPGQNTFSIIPNAPCAINGGASDDSQSRPSKRPMTTKQAKKAYQIANKGPKLSKAERRRQELFEQDRIRREFEKEKNQARARAARDKKREKEEKERAERKRKGLPLVEVRPSQDTIARFVRGIGRKQEDRVVSPSADVSDNCTLSGEDEPEPPPKRQKTASPVPTPVNTDQGYRLNSPSSTGVVDRLTPPAQELNGEEDPAEVNDLIEGQSLLEFSDIDVDDPATIELLHDELFNEFNDATGSPTTDETIRDREPRPPRNQNIPNGLSPIKPSDGRLSSPISPQESPPEHKAEDSASLPPVRRPLRILATNELNSRNNNAFQGLAADQTKPALPLDDAVVDFPGRAPQKTQSSILQAPSPSFWPPKTPMGPPPIPPRFQSRRHASAGESKTPSFLLKQSHTANRATTNHLKPDERQRQLQQETLVEHPPTSTQLFMISHLDDLFPSPSQEVRELFGEPKLSIGPGDNRLTLGSAYRTRSPLDKNLQTNSVATVSSLNRPVSVKKEGKIEKVPFQDNAPPDQSRNSSSLLAANLQSSGNSEAFSMPFFSTQDLFLSSQDIKDIEDEPSPSGVKRRGPIRQSESALDNHISSTTKVDRSVFAPGLTASVSPLARKQSRESRPYSRARSINNHGRPPESQLLGAPIKHLENSAMAHTNTSSLKAEAEGGSLHNREVGSKIKPTERPGRVTPYATSFPQEKSLGALQTKKCAIPPRASPKPFFTSSSRGVIYEYVIERSKTTTWEDASVRQKAQEKLKYFERSENERLDKYSQESMAADEHIYPGNADVLSSKSPSTDLNPRLHNQPKGQSQPRSINQLTSSTVNVERQKSDEPNEDRQRRDRSRSSYKQMLQLLERKENQKQEQQVVPSASQETDYGDAGLDDVLCEML